MTLIEEIREMWADGVGKFALIVIVYCLLWIVVLMMAFIYKIFTL